MFGETLSIALGLIFSSIGLIFFIYYYVMRIGSFDVQLAIQSSKHAELFEDRPDTQLTAALLQDEKSEHDGSRFYFTFIFDGVLQFMKDFFSYQMRLILFLALLFLFITIFLLEEYLGSFYVTLAFIPGVIFSVMMHYFASKIGRNTIGVIIFQSIEGGYEAFTNTFQISYNSALSLIIFFLSSFNILLILMTAFYRATYVDHSNFNEYENMFYLLMGGFTLGYAFAAFFFRVSGTLFQTSVNTAADLIQKSDDEIKADDFFNPCSMPNQVAVFYKNFMSSFSDITTLFMLVTTVILISTCGSQDFTKDKTTFYFIEVYFGFVIIASLIAAIFLRFSFFKKNDLINLSTKNYRLQLVLNHLGTLAFNIFVPLLAFSNDFSYSIEDNNLAKGKIINFKMEKMSSGYIVLCIFMGYMAEIILLIVSEFFTSHIYRPVRSLLDKSENGPCLNLFTTTIISMISFLVPIFCFFLCFFVSYGALGYFGLSICAVGLIANLIPVFAINCVASWAEQSIKLIRLSKLMVEEEIKSNPLFNINWATQNFYMHIRIVTFGGFFIGGLALIGCYVGRPISKPDLLSFKTLQFLGLFFGSMVPFLLGGVLLAMIQKLLQSNFLLSKKEFAYFPGIKKGVDKPDFSKIFSDATFKANVFTFLLFFFNFMIVYFYGLFLGIEGIFGVLLSLIICSSFMIYSAFMSGTALTNSKNFADNNNTVEEYGPIAASVSIGEMFSLLTKEAVPSLMVIIIFDFMLCLLSLRMFDATAWVASGVGLV